MARCLVLGANGFIGSYLVEQLLDNNHFVRCFDRYKSRDISFGNKSQNTEIYRGDFLSRNSLDIALRDIDYVFHFISSTTPISSENDPIIDIQTNVRMSVELFELCKKNSVKKVVFASTGGAIYGNTGEKMVNEDCLPKPVSPYAIGKLTIENYLRYFKTKYGLDYMIFRISNPYGPRQNTLLGQGVIPIFLNKILNDEPLEVFGDGSMVRDYIYIEDVARMIGKSFLSQNSHEVYNLGAGVGTSINNIIEVMRSIVNKDIRIINTSKPETFVDSIVLDSSRLINEFDLKAEIMLSEGMYKTWKDLCKKTLQ